MDRQPGDITILLHKWKEGDKHAENELFDVVMPHLTRLARNRLRKERPGHALDTVALVSEAYVRLLKAKDRDWQSRSHFFAISARVMRRYLIDEWRRSPRADFVSPPSDLVARGRNLDLEIEVDRLLEELAEVNPELCQVVELKHYLGLTDEETADALGLRLHTMQRRWRDAREWLFSRLEKKHAEQIAG